MSGIVKIEVITGMSKLTDLIQNLSKVGVRGATVMQDVELRWELRNTRLSAMK